MKHDCPLDTIAHPASQGQEELRDESEAGAKQLEAAKRRNRKLHRENVSLREKAEMLESLVTKQSEREISREERKEAQKAAEAERLAKQRAAQASRLGKQAEDTANQLRAWKEQQKQKQAEKQQRLHSSALEPSPEVPSPSLLKPSKSAVMSQEFRHLKDAARAQPAAQRESLCSRRCAVDAPCAVAACRAPLNRTPGPKLTILSLDSLTPSLFVAAGSLGRPPAPPAPAPRPGAAP